MRTVGRHAQIGLGRAIPALAALLALAVLGAGCGNAEEPDGSHPDYAKALAGAPAPLAALHEQAGELLDGGVDAYEKRIEALRGYPVVVNVWASWCGPCRFEFPYFQGASAKFGKRIAFLGIDKEDSDGHASSFLEEAPVPYPSYTDPDEDISETVGATRGLPDTAYYDREGELCGLKEGPYTDEAALEEDIRRYALEEECDSA